MTEPAAAAGARVLIAEDERHLGTLLEHFLVGRGHSVSVVHDGRAAVERLSAEPFDVALLDVQMPGLDGLGVLRVVRAMPLPPQVVVMTGNGTVETALTAMQSGAYDYVSKPYRMAEIELLVRRAAERRHLERDAVAADSLVPAIDAPITSWAPLRAVLDLVMKAVPSVDAMLVHGEPGTGRTHLARWVHALAGGGAFVRVDGAAPLDEATLARRIAAARGGTLQLAAVEALPAWAQRLVADTLAATEPAPPRVIATTARTLSSLALDETLHGRLSAVVVELPPLRDRVGDVSLLAESLVRRLGGASPPAITAAAATRLERHGWPGNVAELRLVIERAIARATSGVIEPEHLGLDTPPATP